MRYALIINGRIIERSQNQEGLIKTGAKFKARNRALHVKVERVVNETRTIHE